MKKIIGIICLILSLSACDSQLDIIPKGKTTLDKVSDLELLLNQEYCLVISTYDNIGMICNESLGMASSIPEMLSLTNSLEHAYLTFDEQTDRARLTQSDERYSACYKYINYMNVLLEKVPDAEGEDSKKESIMAEAHILRAYFHWLMANLHAKQYDDATAANEGGIAYVDDADVSKQKEKLSLKDTYQKILDDCSDDIIGKLPNKQEKHPLRANKAFGYAVRAKVLMQMKHYAEALPYALKALQQNNTIEDRSSLSETYSWILPYDATDNYVYMRGTSRAAPFMETLSKESCQLFEEGDYVINYDGGWNEMFGMMFAGIEGVKIYFGFGASINEYGINSDRMYYTAAECYIRTNEIRKGIELIDKVRAKRIEDYTPFTTMYDDHTMNEKEAMTLLQKAKWIECLSTYENFFDCKRWNTEEAYKRTITRDLGEYGQFSIQPNSPLWVLPFPANAVRYNSSLTQNY